MSIFKIVPSGNLTLGVSQPNFKIRAGDELPLGKTEEGILFYKTQEPNSGLHVYKDGWVPLESEEFDTTFSLKTGSEITYDTNAIWNTYENPTDQNLTQTMIPEPVVGTTQIIYHSSATAPVLPYNWVKSDNSDSYDTDNVNIITAQYLSVDLINYSISSILTPFTVEIDVTGSFNISNPLISNGTYTIDWGDGTTSTNTSTHTYTTSGTSTYKIKIRGTVDNLDFSNTTNPGMNTVVKKVYGSEPLTVTTGVITFQGCSSLTSVTTRSLTLVTNCNDAWNGCTSLDSFDTSGLTSVTTCNNAWNGCTSLTEFDTSGLTSVTTCASAWNGCTDLDTFNSYGLTSVADCNNAWNGCIKLESFDTRRLTSVINCDNAWEGCTEITSFNTGGLISMQTCTEAWKNCSKLVNFDATTLKSIVTCNRSWEGCSLLESFDTSSFKAVTSCYGTWKNCGSLETFNASGLISVTILFDTWFGCKISSFDTSILTNVTSCIQSWRECSFLTSFNASGLTKVTDCNNAWYQSGLVTFDSTPLTSVNFCANAWAKCGALVTFDASGLVAVTNCENAWEGCSVLNTFRNDGYPQALRTGVLVAYSGSFANTPLLNPDPVLPYPTLYKTVAEVSNTYNITLNTDAVWWSPTAPLEADFSSGNKKFALNMDPADKAVVNTKQTIYFKTTASNTNFEVEKNPSGWTGEVTMLNHEVAISTNQTYVMTVTYLQPDAICEVKPIS